MRAKNFKPENHSGKLLPVVFEDRLWRRANSRLKPLAHWSDAMFLHVLEARYVRDYMVQLTFSDGAVGEVDLSAELEGPVFGALQDIEQFKQFSVTRHTLAWPNSADFAPEFLREQAAVAV